MRCVVFGASGISCKMERVVCRVVPTVSIIDQERASYEWQTDWGRNVFMPSLHNELATSLKLSKMWRQNESVEILSTPKTNVFSLLVGYARAHERHWHLRHFSQKK